jgi:glycosyltransferase involved in cell wall biosynthesis
MVERLGLQGRVEFRFDLSEADKRRLIQESRVMVLPSAVEGFGIVVLEANACGVPVIASTGVPEGAVRDGFNGLRYQFGDIPALSRQIVKLLQDTALYASLSDNAMKNAQRFAWSRVGAEFESVVRKAASSTQPAR